VNGDALPTTNLQHIEELTKLMFPSKQIDFLGKKVTSFENIFAYSALNQLVEQLLRSSSLPIRSRAANVAGYTA
jgi:hypothetical protein